MALAVNGCAVDRALAASEEGAIAGAAMEDAPVMPELVTAIDALAVNVEAGTAVDVDVDDPIMEDVVATVADGPATAAPLTAGPGECAVDVQRSPAVARTATLGVDICLGELWLGALAPSVALDGMPWALAKAGAREMRAGIVRRLIPSP